MLGELATTNAARVPDTYKPAWIIDGQHRLYGYTELGEDERGSHLPFLAFENISIADETKIFADIHRKQKSVSKKLLDEITGEIKLDSADKREQLRAIASDCVFDRASKISDCKRYAAICATLFQSRDRWMSLTF